MGWTKIDLAGSRGLGTKDLRKRPNGRLPPFSRCYWWQLGVVYILWTSVIQQFRSFFFLTGDLPDQYHLLTLDTMQFRGCELPTFWRLSTCHLFRLFKLGSSALRSNKPVEVKLPEIQIFSQMIWKFGALRMCFSQVCRAIRRISSEP